MLSVNHGKCGKCSSTRLLIKPRHFLPLYCTFSLLSFNIAGIIFIIESCMSLGGGVTLEALVVALFSFLAAAADSVCRETLLKALEVEFGLGITIFYCVFSSLLLKM
jgi:hypothetical protein